MKLILHTDGASRGNPGLAAFGVVLADVHGQTIEEFGKTIGKASNNEAEYQGLLAGLDAALRQGARELEIRLDSELIVAQLNGRYKIRAANLKPLFDDAKKKMRLFTRVNILHIPRALNAHADELANRALDEQSTHGR